MNCLMSTNIFIEDERAAGERRNERMPALF